MRRTRLLTAIACCVAAYAVTISIRETTSLEETRSLQGTAHPSLAGGLELELGLVAEARADGEIRVGDELMAIDDVSLDQARICKGSKVSVSGKAIRAGVVFLDVALADGHVVRSIPMIEIRRSFRVVNA